MAIPGEQNRICDEFEAYTSYTTDGDIWNSDCPVVCENGNKSALIGSGGKSSLYTQTNGFTSDVTGIRASFSIKFNTNLSQNVIFGAASSSVPSTAGYRVLQFYSGGEKMQIAASDNIPISYKTGVWYQVDLSLDYSTGAYELSVNDGNKTSTWSTDLSALKKSDNAKADIKYYTFWIESTKDGESVQIDDVDIYGVTPSGSLCFYVNENSYCLNGSVYRLDSANDMAVTKIIDGTAYVPADVLADCLELDIKKGTDGLSVSDAEKNLFLAPGKYTTYADELYVPVRAVAEYFSHKVYYHKSGLIVISNRENYFDLTTSDISLFRNLTYSLCCDEPSQAEIASYIDMAELSRPRIVLNSDLLENLKHNIKTYPQIAKWYESIKALAEDDLEKPVLVYESDSYSGILAISQEARRRIPRLALVYLVEGDESYAKKAVIEMLSISSFPDWNPYRALDTAEMNLAMGLGYDWLYNYMTTEQRDKIKTALVEKGLRTVLEDYTGKYTYVNDDGRSRSTYFTKLGDNPHNWVYVCNSGAIVGALSVAEEETELSSRIVSYALENWGRALRFLGPDGVHDEGPMYNNWMLVSMTNAFSSLDNTFGTDFGLVNMPGVKDFTLFNSAHAGSVSTFNFNNSDDTKSNANSTGMFYFASYHNDDNIGKYRTFVANKYGITPGYQDLIYAKPDFLTPSGPSAKDEYYQINNKYSMFVLRSGTQSENAINIAATSSVCQTSSQADIGSFIIDAFGTRFACDMGKANYEGTWFDKYKNRAEGHNVIVVNPDSSPGFVTGKYAPTEKVQSDSDEGFVVYNLTDCYPDGVESAKRGYKLFDNRSRIIIQDEIKMSDLSEMYWFMHTECDVKIKSDGKHAVLKGDTKNMHLRIDSNVDATFTVMDARLLPTSPTSDSSYNNGYKKLAIHLTDVVDLSLAVVIDFEYHDAKPKYSIPQKTPLDLWALTEDSPHGVPHADMIYLNGVALKGFAPYEHTYKCILPPGAPVPQITVNSEGSVGIKNITSPPGTALIEITDSSGMKAEYGIVFEYTDDTEVSSDALNTDRCAFPVYAVSASQTLSKTNNALQMVDRSTSTYWRGKGEQFIDFNLGDEKIVTSVIMAVKGSLRDGRQQIFDIAVSCDGANWSDVLTHACSSGITDDGEQFSFNPTQGRYVRIKLHGNTVDDYNSISEVRIFGKELEGEEENET